MEHTYGYITIIKVRTHTLLEYFNTSFSVCSLPTLTQRLVPNSAHGM